MLVRDRGTPLVASRGRLGPCTRARCWVGTTCPRTFCMALPGTTTAKYRLWARRSTALPAKIPQALAAFPRFASRLRKGAGDASRVCRQLKPAQDTVTSQHGRTVSGETLPSPAVGDSKMQITQLRHHPGSVRWRVLECTGKGEEAAGLGQHRHAGGTAQSFSNQLSFLHCFKIKKKEKK